MAFVAGPRWQLAGQRLSARCSPRRGFVVTKMTLEESATGGDVADGDVKEEVAVVADGDVKEGVPVGTYPGPVLAKEYTSEAKPFRVSGETALDVSAASVGTALRAASGLLVAGYSFRLEDGKFIEESTSLPESRPELPLYIYEFTACPFCRKVREAIAILDLDVMFYPCPRGSKRFRPQVVELGGKAQFPYLVDPNTGFSGYESDDIIKYLFETYYDGVVPLALRLGGLTTLTSGLSSLMSFGKGAKRAEKVVYPDQPLTLWGYEASPFSRIVIEKLCEYEIPYLLKTTGRGSPKRKELAEKTGIFCAPYIEDPNTGVNLFESKDILKYLDEVYGPEAENAVDEVPEGVATVKAPA